MLYLVVLIGGGIGAVTRFVLSVFIQRYSPDFPLGTFIINITGALMIGFLSVYLTESIDAAPAVKLFLITGLLGGYTTFSTFTLEGFKLMENGQYLKAFYYIGGTNIIGFLFIWLGRIIGGLL